MKESTNKRQNRKPHLFKKLLHIEEPILRKFYRGFLPVGFSRTGPQDLNRLQQVVLSGEQQYFGNPLLCPDTKTLEP